MRETFEVRDMRIKEKFFVDDIYLNGFAKKIGWHGSLVYFVLCRHANNHQECFPSIRLISEKVGICKNSVRDGLGKLVKYNVIKVKKTKNKKGSYKSNIYTLLDKSHWMGGASHEPGGASHEPGVVHHMNPLLTKDTHIEGYTSKENHGASLLNNDKIKKTVARAGNHAVDSEANQLAVAELVTKVCADKTVRNQVGAAIYRAKNK